MSKSIPSVFDAEPIPDCARAEVEELLKSGDLFRYTAPTDQPTPVARLEHEFAKRMGVKYALALNSCSSAIFLSLRALGVKPNDPVLIPAFTFAAVPSAVIHAGGKPILVEVGDNYRIDLADFEAKLTPQIAAVVISHMRGHTSDMDAIMALCNMRGVPVIEDAAHSLGTLWQGQKIGTIGKLGCFSFQSYKMVNGGEGGMLITNDEDVIAQAIIMSGAYEHNWQKHGLNINAFAEYQNTLPLFNLRMNNLTAAIIRPQLSELERRVTRGRRNHDHVAALLNKSPWLQVPTPLAGEVRAPDSIQFNLIDFSEAEARQFVAACGSKGVPVSVFGLNTDNARAFWNWKFIGNIPDLPKTRAMLVRACDLRLPARLDTAELDAIAQDILTALNKIKPAHSSFHKGSGAEHNRPVRP
ncbi:MAG: aminotransferase class I/II-fold pyridoxal phosphate-dependent enzyme [Alphaproteobacteria bacterium]|nr:aminotransferase class I/II-fold pyridoxal phosphate-dependent enzyme [Alphaproteobacteria bacterium]